MITRSTGRFACLLLAGVAAATARAETPALIEPVPAVALPLTVPRRVPRVIVLASADTLPDPLRGTPGIRPDATGEDAMQVLSTLLPGRTDTPYDWYAPVEPLHENCEPRALPPCVPPPPCHPSEPPHPYDLVGMHGCPSGGPIYGGPCEPRTGTPHHGVWAWYHRLHDRFFDHFYKWK
jgi:hypothetical protein